MIKFFILGTLFGIFISLALECSGTIFEEIRDFFDPTEREWRKKEALEEVEQARKHSTFGE